MSYKYKDTEVNPSAPPTVTPTVPPTVPPSTPTSSPTPTPDGKECVKITALYNADGSLKDVKTEKILITDIKPVSNTNLQKIFYWESLESMKPITVNYNEESDSIVLNYNTYPLVVGNKSKTDFSDWETYGSTVQLTAEVNNSEYTASDITWQSENADIATVTSSGKVQGRTTGFTNIYAVLPNGNKKSCVIAVIDNITRSTMGTLEFNTSSLSLAVGADAELIPIINPKDIYGNGTLDTSLKWETSNAAVAAVENGKVTAVSAGTATIKATSNDVGRTAECVVTVSDNTAPAQLTADIQPVDIKVGETAQLNAQSDSKIIWKSDNSFIADVDENGVVTAYSNSNVPRLIDNPNYIAGSDKVTEASEKIVVFEDGKVQYDKSIVKIYATSASGEVKTFEIAVSDADLKPVTNDYNSAQTQNNSEEQLDFAGEGYLDNLHIPKETITDNSVNILWNSSSKMDIPDLAEYKIFVNGEETDTVTTLGYTANNLLPTTEYSITVQAVDNSGNVLKEDNVTVTTKEKSQIVNVLDYGAKGNGKVMDTYAIQKAINDCPENGTVYLPKGYIFYSGALFLKSNMTFKVDGILICNELFYK
ncbi:MAG: Ig-like domain-containing protein [Clostridia bacterium]